MEYGFASKFGNVADLQEWNKVYATKPQILEAPNLPTFFRLSLWYLSPRPGDGPLWSLWPPLTSAMVILSGVRERQIPYDITFM